MLAAILLLGAIGTEPLPGDLMVPSRKQREMLSQFDKLGYLERIKFIDELGKKRDFASLALLYKSELAVGDYAATVHCHLVDDRQSVEFCKQFEVGSPNWRAAYWGLSEHKREYVIDYIKNIARMKYADLRALSYTLCEGPGWDDLVAYAKADENNDVWVLGGIGVTAGRVARGYLETIKKKR